MAEKYGSLGEGHPPPHLSQHTLFRELHIYAVYR